MFRGSNPAQTVPGENPNAGSRSHDSITYPYGQIMYRLNPKVVIGADVTFPTLGALKWTTGNARGTRTRLYAANYSAKISYAYNDDWTFGLGLDVLAGSGKVSFIVPGTANQSVNKGTGSRAGWDAGLTYKINQGGWLGFSYKSRQYAQAKGQSTFPGRPWSLVSQNVNMPDTFTASYLQFWSEKWMTNLDLRYILFKHAYKFYNVTSPAFAPGNNVPFRQNYKNSWSAEVFTRYHFAEQWAGIAAINYDSNPMKQTKWRTLNFPADAVWFFGGGVQYMPTKTTQVQLFYGYVTSNTKLNHEVIRTRGKVKLQGNQLDLSFTYKF